MITTDFVQRTRARIAEVRAALTELRSTHIRVVQKLTKIAKQQSVDNDRVYNTFTDLAENVVAKLPDEATDDDFDKAHIIQEQVYGLASQVEEILIGPSEIEDLGSAKDLINPVFAGLKEVEARLSEMERFAAKLKL